MTTADAALPVDIGDHVPDVPGVAGAPVVGGAVEHQAADMVGMQMRQKYRVDVLGRDAGRRQAIPQLAHLREGAGAAGVDQHRLLGQMHDIGVDAGGHRRGALEGLVEQAFCLGRLDVGQKRDVEVEIAVGDRGDDRLADANLLDRQDLARRRGRLGGGRQRAEAQQDGGAQRPGNEMAAGNGHGAGSLRLGAWKYRRVRPMQ